jgi:hypothetical protein
MLSSVLRSSRAVEVNIAIMRNIEALEKKYDERFTVVFEAINELIAPPSPQRSE